MLKLQNTVCRSFAARVYSLQEKPRQKKASRSIRDASLLAYCYYSYKEDALIFRQMVVLTISSKWPYCCIFLSFIVALCPFWQYLFWQGEAPKRVLARVWED